MIMLTVCEKMGWDEDTYLAQSNLFINKLLAKWNTDSYYEEQEAKQRQIESGSKLKK